MWLRVMLFGAIVYEVYLSVFLEPLWAYIGGHVNFFVIWAFQREAGWRKCREVNCTVYFAPVHMEKTRMYFIPVQDATYVHSTHWI